MLHNGIEYADMQLIAEACFLLRHLAGLEDDAMARIFDAWNRGPLESYLVEISAEILRTRDGESGRPLLGVIRDRAGEKGTGRWAAIAALAVSIEDWRRGERDAVRACSTLKASYRETLRAGGGETCFVPLTGAPQLIRDRLAARAGHYMPAALLDSQLAGLEPPGSDEDAITVDIEAPSETVVAEILERLAPALSATPGRL